MRVLIWLVVVAALLWGGYWVVGSRAVEAAAQGWFTQQQDHGRIAEHGGLAVAGFPNRFDLTLTDLHLADPGSGYGWSAPLLQFATMSWKPWHILVGFAPSQTLHTPFGDIALTTGPTEASLVMVPGPDLRLDRTVLISHDLRATLPQGGTITADALRFATRPGGALPNGQDLGLEVTGLAADAALLERLAPAGGLPAQIDTLMLDAVAGFTAPLDRHAEARQPRLNHLTIKQAMLHWGELRLDASGDLVADAQGFAEGRLDLRLTNGRQLIELAAAMGLIAPGSVPTYAALLTRLQRGSDDGTAVTLPLTFARGQTRFGLIPLGPAPRLQ